MDDTDIELCSESKLEKVHAWRICPVGTHYVKEHRVHIPPSKTHPNGEVVARKAHCAHNPSHKDVLSFDEIQAIARRYFSDLSGKPKAHVLTEYAHADDFDTFIGGWVFYWNDVLGMEDPLDPNYVKAIIATESDFDAQTDNKVNKKIHAHGLM